MSCDYLNYKCETGDTTWRVAKFYMLVKRGSMQLASHRLFEREEDATHAMEYMALDATVVPVIVSEERCFDASMGVVGFKQCEHATF